MRIRPRGHLHSRSGDACPKTPACSQNACLLGNTCFPGHLADLRVDLTDGKRGPARRLRPDALDQGGPPERATRLDGPAQSDSSKSGLPTSDLEGHACSDLSPPGGGEAVSRRRQYRGSGARLPAHLEAYLRHPPLPIGREDPTGSEGPRSLRPLDDCDPNPRRRRRVRGRDEGAVAGEEIFRISYGVFYGRSGGSEKGVFSTSPEALLSVPLGLTDVTR